MSRCPYCGIEDGIDDAAAQQPLPGEGDFTFCAECGGPEVFTGVLWESRLPTKQEAGILREFIGLMQREVADDIHAIVRESSNPPPPDTSRSMN